MAPSGARIDTVNSDTSITLKDNWRGATLPAGSSYYIRYQPDGSRYAALLAAVRKILTQPLLTAFAGLTGAADTIAYFTGPASIATVSFKAWARSLLGLTMAADKLPYGSGANTMALADFTADGRNLVGANLTGQKALLGVSATGAFKNTLINGDFDVWQRAISQTTGGYGSDDRWANAHNISTKTHSRQTFDLGHTAVPGNPRYFSRTVVSSVPATNALVNKNQAIESVKTHAGKTVTITY